MRLFSITVAGTETGDTVSLYSNDNTCSLPSIKGSSVATGANTSISTSLAVDGSYTFYAKQTDAAGTSSACSTVTVTYALKTSTPTLAVSVPTTATYINSTNISSFAVSGNCSNVGTSGNVSISIVGLSGSPVTGSTTCSSSWSVGNITGLSALPDGQLTLTANLIDSAGNPATPVVVKFNKVTTVPTLTQTTTTSPATTIGNSITWGGACNGTNQIIVSGTDSSTFACSSGSWSYTSNSQTTDGSYNYNFTETDVAGNTASISTSWTRNTSKPTLASFTVTNTSPTNSLTYNLTYGA